MRRYYISFNRVAVSAAQDLFELLVAADEVMILEELHITQDSDAGDTESEQLAVSIRRVTGAPTSGSGGSTPTPVAANSGDAASGITAEANNTTQISGGTNTVLLTEAFNVMAGLHYLPPPESRPTFAGQTRCVVDLEAGPGDAVTMSGYVVVAEIG
jgi:hypothetical protein